MGRKRNHNDREVDTDHYNKKSFWVFTLFFFFSMTWILIEIKVIDNTINGIQLSIIGGMIGWITSIFIKRKIQKSKQKKLTILKHLYANYKIGISIILVLIGISSLNMINRKFADEKEVLKKYNIINKGKSADGQVLFIFIKTDKREERIIVDPPTWKQLKKYESVTLKTQRGFLGYEIVIGISPNNEN